MKISARSINHTGATVKPATGATKRFHDAKHAVFQFIYQKYRSCWNLMK